MQDGAQLLFFMFYESVLFVGIPDTKLHFITQDREYSDKHLF